MRYAQWKFPGTQRTLQYPHFRLSGKRKFNFRLNQRRTVQSVALQNFKKSTISIRRIVKIGDRLMQPFRWKV